MEASLSLNHRPIGRSTHPRGFAGDHARYIVRDEAVSVIMGTRQDTAQWGAAIEDVLRTNGRVCDRIVYAFSREIPKEERPRVVSSFVETLTSGNADNVAWIAGIHDLGKDERNPHVHIMIADRHLQTGQKVWHSGRMGSTEMARRVCEEVQNAALDAIGASRIDRRSYAVRNFNIMPTRHVGLNRGTRGNAVQAFNVDVVQFNQQVAELQSLDIELQALLEQVASERMAQSSMVVPAPVMPSERAGGRDGPANGLEPSQPLRGGPRFAVGIGKQLSSSLVFASIPSVTVSVDHRDAGCDTEHPKHASLVSRRDAEPSIAFNGRDTKRKPQRVPSMTGPSERERKRKISDAVRVFSLAELVRTVEGDLYAIESLFPGEELLADPYDPNRLRAAALEQRMNRRLDLANLPLPAETSAWLTSNMFSRGRMERNNLEARQLRVSAAAVANALDAAEHEEETRNVGYGLQREWSATYAARADREQLAKVRRDIKVAIRRIRDASYYGMNELEIPAASDRCDSVPDAVRDRLERINTALERASRLGRDPRTLSRQERKRARCKDDLAR